MGTLQEVCKGRWQGLLPALGLDTRYLTGKHGPCPLCGGKDRWRFDDKGGKGSWFCSHCGAGEGLRLVMLLKNVDFRGACDLVTPLVGQVKVTVSRQERGSKALEDARERLWRQAEIVQDGDLVSHYLERRGLNPIPYPGDLRYTEKCRYDQGTNKPEWHPAMLARVSDAEGHPCQLHRTFLDSVGNKAKVKEPRKLMPGPIPKGSAIRLGGTPAQGEAIGIAEGVETALAAAQLFEMKVWAAFSASQLISWVPPPEVGEVVIFADNDRNYTGQSAAYALAHKLALVHVGLPIRVEIPPKPGTDWNDVVLEV